MVDNTTPEDAPVVFKFDDAYFDDPYAQFASMRVKAPVHRLPGGFLLTRYDHIHHVVKDAHFGRDGFEESIRKNWGLGDKPAYVLPAMFRDPPDHTRLRAVLNRAFTGKVVESLAPMIQRTMNDLLDRVEKGRPLDFVNGFAYTLPITTLCHLLGVPQGHHESIYELSQAHGAAITAGPINDQNREVIERADQLHIEWGAFVNELADQRRREPKEDLISGLVQARDEGHKITDYELVATVVGLLFAGHTTTTDAISSGLVALMRNRDQWERLVKDPSLIEPAVDEILRYDPPVQIYARVALVDEEVGGVPIPKGSRIWPMSGAANHDPAYFIDPDRFDIGRPPTRHVTFGSGIHFCQGARLARLQMEIVFRTLVERCPRIALVDETIKWRHNAAFRGPTSLQVTLD